MNSTRTFRGYMNKKGNNLFMTVVRELLEEGEEVLNKQFNLKNEYVNEFLFKEYKGKRIEFTATVENKNIRNIRIVKKGGFSYNTEERRESLASFYNKKYHVFTGVFKRVKKEGNHLKFLFNDIKHNDKKYISDHVFIEFKENNFHLKPDKKYVFVAKVKEYKKGYSEDTFYGIEDISSGHIKYHKKPKMENLMNIDFHKLVSNGHFNAYYKSEDILADEYIFLKQNVEYRVKKSLIKNFPLVPNINYRVSFENDFQIENDLTVTSGISKIKLISPNEDEYSHSFTKDMDNVIFYIRKNHITNLINGQKIRKKNIYGSREDRFFKGYIRNGIFKIGEPLTFQEVTNR